jgi:non-homologous end joining protein Ku
MGGRGIKLKEMLDLAAHIGHTKPGHFDLSRLEDRYENALSTYCRRKGWLRKAGTIFLTLLDEQGRLEAAIDCLRNTV